MQIENAETESVQANFSRSLILIVTKIWKCVFTGREKTHFPTNWCRKGRISEWKSVLKDFPTLKLFLKNKSKFRHLLLFRLLRTHSAVRHLRWNLCEWLFVDPPSTHMLVLSFCFSRQSNWPEIVLVFSPNLKQVPKAEIHKHMRDALRSIHRMKFGQYLCS